MSFRVAPPSSCGLILSYQCSARCRHCLNASSPAWPEWATPQELDRVLEALARHGDYLNSLYISGGEPMLRPDLVAHVIGKAKALDMPIDYVETNAFWCWDEDSATEGFEKLHAAGLRKVLISISPFHAEYVPLLNAEIAMDAAQSVFGTQGVLLNTAEAFQELVAMNVDDTIELERYLEAKGREEAALTIAGDYGLVPNGRAALALADLFERQPAENFFGEACDRELASPHHVRVDGWGNVSSQNCAGICLGNLLDETSPIGKTDWADRPVVRRLISGGVEALLAWAESAYDYQRDIMGYTSKCHLCLDIRRHLASQDPQLTELAPKPFYDELEHQSDID